MNEEKLLPDDPRLTAYALEAMEPAERAEFERILAGDAAARVAVEEIRATAAALTEALAHEPIEAGPESYARTKVKPGMLLRFPQFYFVVSGLAAACFAVFFIVHEQQATPHFRTTVVEVPLASPPMPQPAPAPMELPAAAPVVAQDNEFAAEKHLDDRAAAGGLDAKVADALAGTAAPAVTRARGEIAASYAKAIAKRQSAGKVVANALGSRLEADGFQREDTFVQVTDQPRSTFAPEVDPASYAGVRRLLKVGRRPPADAVRIEEMVNAFSYDYAPPTDDAPFAVALEAAAAPWAPAHRLVRIGVKAREAGDAARPAANLVFVVDVAHSPNAPNRLALVKQSLRQLVARLRPVDRVAIACDAGTLNPVLPSTSAAHRAEILDAIDRLEVGAPATGAPGILLAYDLAKANFIPGGVNRVILATGGDFNLGATKEGELGQLVEAKAKAGVLLTVLGFGTGHGEDAALARLAEQGNGRYAAVQTLGEAKKTLIEQAGGTFAVIAKDVKLEVAFNPAEVQAYRLLGYESRLPAKDEFNHDEEADGEIEAGHKVTALYEVVPAGATMPGATPAGQAPQYEVVSSQRSAVSGGSGKQESETPKLAGAGRAEMLTVTIRYKEPVGDMSGQLEFALHDGGAAFADASQDFKFAAAVAAFGLELRGSPDKGSLTLADVAAWGRAGAGSDPGGDRQDFIGLVEQAQHVVQ